MIIREYDGPDGLEIDNDGNKRYWKNNMRHRLDGPAVERSDGSKYWHVNGVHIKVSSQEEFKQYMRLKAFH